MLRDVKCLITQWALGPRPRLDHKRQHSQQHNKGFKKILIQLLVFQPPTGPLPPPISWTKSNFFFICNPFISTSEASTKSLHFWTFQQKTKHIDFEHPQLYIFLSSSNRESQDLTDLSYLSFDSGLVSGYHESTATTRHPALFIFHYQPFIACSVMAWPWLVLMLWLCTRIP